MFQDKIVEKIKTYFVIETFQNRHTVLKSLVSNCFSHHRSRRCVKYRKCPYCGNSTNFLTRSEIQAVEDGFDLNYSTANSTSAAKKQSCSIFLISIQPSSVGDVSARIYNVEELYYGHVLSLTVMLCHKAVTLVTDTQEVSQKENTLHQ